ncbi:hypothetical protein PRUPE_1G066000 [Prunus persica]|uniref:Uncharacterized protein n=1 Tax=Prunus persica TaxID=3760 RepID=A0A251QUF5_PRUPE|nr:hypothetical protein PRUPE_1G066000 [Prunus persica]
MIECIEAIQYYANSCVRLLKFVKNEPGGLRVKCNGKAEKRHCLGTIVGFDGCFIKGAHPGQLLTVAGIDANTSMFPIAFGARNGWVIITDKQKVLRKATEDLVSSAKHRHCVRHRHANFRTPGHCNLALRQILWAATRATIVPWWEAEMEKIRDLSRKAYKWLDDRPANHWSISHFKTSPKCDMLLNNLCECFNYAISEARDKPILTMLERLRSYLVLRMARQREMQWTQKVRLGIVMIMEKPLNESGSCIAQHAGRRKYEVMHKLGGQYVVDLNRHTCSCRK